MSKSRKTPAKATAQANTASAESKATDVTTATAAVTNEPAPKQAATKAAAPKKTGNIEVTAASPFYDLQGKQTRTAGAKFNVSEDRAKELRNKGLIK